MKVSSEAKLGVIGIVTLAALIWGINYLKGRNILSNSYTLTAYYSDAAGLESSAPVLMNGVKIGFIKEVDLNPEDSIPITVILSIENRYPIQMGSQAVLISADLLGTKAIRIDASDQHQILNESDIIQSSIEPDMLTSLQSKLRPVVQQISALAVSLDTLVIGLDHVISSEATKETLDHFASISESFAKSLEPGGSLDQSFISLASFATMLENQEDDLTSLIGHFNSIGESVDSAGIDNLARELQAVTHQFNLLLEKINSGEGNAGKFFHEDSLYQNLDLLITDLDELIKDLKENPQDYVQISLFGSSQKKK